MINNGDISRINLTKSVNRIKDELVVIEKNINHTKDINQYFQLWIEQISQIRNELDDIQFKHLSSSIFYDEEKRTSIFLLLSTVEIKIKEVSDTLSPNPSRTVTDMKNFFSSDVLLKILDIFLSYKSRILFIENTEKTQQFDASKAELQSQVADLKSGLEELKYNLAKSETRLREATLRYNQVKDKNIRKVYFDSSNKYSCIATCFEVAFGTVVIAGGGVLYYFYSIHTLPEIEFSSPLFKVNYLGLVLNYLLPKLLVLTISITLITFFLRKASHYRKLADQGKQTVLELTALPFFIKNLSDDVQAEIYKDLAGKYFGRMIDQTQNDKIGDLVQEQAKINMDMAKTMTEAFKTYQESDKKVESKPQNNTQQT